MATSIYKARQFKDGKMVELDYNAIYCKDTPDALEAIRKELMERGKVEVHNNYESFYGVGFGDWLRKGIEDIPCDIEAFQEVNWLEFATRYIITKK